MTVLTDDEVAACIHRRQGARFLLALIFTVLLLPVMAAIFVVGSIFLILPWVLFLIWIGAEIFLSNFIGNSILVSPMNYPRIFEISEEMKASLKVDKKIFVFVYKQGDFNAYMARLFFRRAIFLNSEIVEAGVSDDELRWLIGRFIGYWRAQKRSGVGGWLVRMAQRFLVLNFFILPYDRAMVYTGDRLALAAIGGDLSTGISAMQKLLVGRQLGYSVNPVGMVEQHRLVKGSVFAFLARLGSGFPHTTARYVDIIAFAKRRFPDQFARFEADNPGLPSDIAALSSEEAGAGPVLKAIGAATVVVALMFVSTLLAGGVIALSSRANFMPNLQGSAPLALEPTEPAVDTAAAPAEAAIAAPAIAEPAAATRPASAAPADPDPAAAAADPDPPAPPIPD